MNTPWDLVTIKPSLSQMSPPLARHIVVDSEGEDICFLPQGCEEEARLAAAAPDLLQALQDLMDNEGGEPYKGDPIGEEVWARCHAAIAKAKGSA